MAGSWRVERAGDRWKWGVKGKESGVDRGGEAGWVLGLRDLRRDDGFELVGRGGC